MSYEVKHIPLEKIYVDNAFNCRGAIMPIDVMDLVKDIKANDLQFPIAVQPCSEVTEGLPEGYEYRIIAGHRRFIAFRVLQRLTIPAMVKSGLSELQARLVNFNENLQRKDLDILQEAKAIEKLKFYGMRQDEIATELGMSRSWVQCRFHLLELPEDIQQEAAAGFLNQYQIKQLYGLGSAEEQFEAVKKVKIARLNGDKSIDIGKTPIQSPYKKKRQSKTAVGIMIGHLGDTVGYGLHTRALAWANGEINSAELFFDIKMFADANGKSYTIPLSGLEQ